MLRPPAPTAPRVASGGPVVGDTAGPSARPRRLERVMLPRHPNGSAHLNPSTCCDRATPRVAIENANEKLEWFGTVRGRLGITFDRVLIYGTGGFAYGHVKVDQNSVPVPGPGPFLFPSSASVTKTGWTAGGGIEWAFSGKWSAKIEGLYYDLGSITSAGSAVNGFMVGKNFDVRGGIARFGVNYRLN
jgi:opacity protein-like surface antigen